MNLKQRLISLSLLAGILGIPKPAESYSTQTIHPGLVPKLIEFYKQTHETSPVFDSEEIKQGTVNEDSPDYAYIRAFNHFHQWQTEEGILNFSNAEYWAQSSEAQSTLISFAKLPPKIRALLGCDSSLPSSECKLNYPFGDHSWEKAKDEFVSGKIERSFGHVFHLIADTTVPAHARNDPHWGDAPFLEKILAMYYSEGAALWPSDVYEVWTSEHADELLIQISPQEIPPVDNLQELFDKLSYFTGSNFYSDGAVDGSVGGLTEITEGKKKYLVKPVEGKQVHVLRKGFFSDFPDVACLQDAWTVLGTKSVEYGAAAVEILINETASDCVDKCEYINQIGCSGNDVAVCADYNKDGCLEWVEPYPCGQGYKCLEGECIASGCASEEWPCADGTCIPTAYLCDGGKDCAGGEDEDGCGCLGTNDCTYEGAKGCFDEGWKECGDFNGDNCLEWGNYHACGADEECSWGECVKTEVCSFNEFFCESENWNGFNCIPLSEVCNGYKNCKGGEDEEGCCYPEYYTICEGNAIKIINTCGGEEIYPCEEKLCIAGYGPAESASCCEVDCDSGGNAFWGCLDYSGSTWFSINYFECKDDCPPPNGDCTTTCDSDADCLGGDLCKKSANQCLPGPSPLCTGASCVPVGIYVYDNGSESDDSFGLEIKDAFYGETPAGEGKEWTVPMVDGQNYEMLLYGIGVPDGIGTYAIELTNAVKVDGPPLNGSDLDNGMSFVWHIKAKK